MESTVAQTSHLLRQLKTFEVTARHMSFTKAADELCISQAAVSHQIRTLEDALQTRLFKRMTRATALPTEGAILQRGVVDGFGRIDRVLAQLAQDSGRARKRLTVAVTPAFSSRWLVQRLDRFLAAHRDLEVRLLHTVMHTDLSRDGIDLAIRWGDGKWPGVECERLFGTTLVPVCAPALLAEGPPLRTPLDLSRHTLLHEDSTDDWERWFDQAGLSPALAIRGPLIDDSNALMQAALGAQGIALGRTALIRDDLRRGLLLCPFDQTLPAQGAYFMCWQPGRGEQEALRWLADFLRAEAVAE